MGGLERVAQWRRPPAALLGVALCGLLLVVSPVLEAATREPFPQIPTTADLPAGDDSQTASTPCLDDGDYHPAMRWLDYSHALLSLRVCESVRWFDAFFGDPDDEVRAHTGAFVRLVSGYRLQDDDDNTANLGYSARLDMPALSRRLSVVLSSDAESAQDDSPFADQTEEFQAGLRWVLRTTRKMDLDADLGLTSGLRTYARLRYRQLWPLGGNWSSTLGETLGWRDGEGLESRTELDFSQVLPRNALLRLRSKANWKEYTYPVDGWAWGQNLSISKRLAEKAALGWILGAEGVTRPNNRLESWSLAVRYRRNVLRPWLFVEIEPFLSWPRTYDFNVVHGVWLRVETRFGLVE